MQFNLTTRVAIYLLCHMLIHYRKLKLIRLNRSARVVRVITCLDHLALIRLEDKTLTLEVVDITLVRAFAIYKEELKIHKYRQSEQQYAHDACHYFTTCIHILSF